MPADEFEHTVEQLYAGPPDQFVAQRDAAVKRARAAGDKELADETKALRRPTLAAALLNQLHRRDGATGLNELLELGHRLRAAQSKLDAQAMKSLSTERNALISQVISEIAKASSEPLSATVQEQLSDTLVAAVADAEAGRAVSSGRLVNALRYSGFGEVDLQNAVAIPLPPQPEAADVTPEDEHATEESDPADEAERRQARRQADAERELSEATAALDAAVRAEEAAQQSAQLAERALSAARRTAKKASARVEQATATRSAAEQAVAAAERAAAELTRR